MKKKEYKYFNWKVKWKILLVYIHYNKKYHKFVNFLKLMWMSKTSNEKTKHDLNKNTINKTRRMTQIKREQINTSSSSSINWHF